MNNTTLYLEFQDYINSTGLAKSTKSTYLNHVRHLYSYAEFYNLELKNFAYKDMIQYKKGLSNIYTSNTINNKLSAVRTFFDYLNQVNYITKNPVFNSLFIKIDKVRPQYITIEERNLLLEYLNTKGHHIRLAFQIMLYGGLRLSEVCAIKKKDVEIREGNKVYIHVQDIKTNKLRLCPIFNQACSDDIILHLENLNTGDLLFTIAPRTLQHYAREFQDKNNIKFSVHTCRHVFATERIREGIKLELLKTLMGHKSINTTLLYIYIAEEEIYSLL